METNTTSGYLILWDVPDENGNVFKKGSVNIDNTFDLETDYDKRDSQKAVTKALIKPLLALKSTLQAQYERTDRCAEEILYLKECGVSKEKRAIKQYCGKRWCSVCAAQKTAHLMKGYMHAIEAMQEPMFLTLTVVSVEASELKPTIKAMQKTFRQITNVMIKRNTPLNGIRKVESNVNVQAQTYNPHFHLIIDGEAEAQTVRQQWIDRNKGATAEAQKLITADKGSLNEFFKYVQKSIVGKRFHAKEQDVINRAFLNVRFFQPFGNVRKYLKDADLRPMTKEDLEFVDAYRQYFERVERTERPVTDNLYLLFLLIVFGMIVITYLMR